MKKTKFLNELAENYKIIFSVYKQVSELGEAGQRVAPATEWLLDNFYIIERQIKSIQSDYTKKWTSALPCGMDGQLRIYNIAKDIIQKADVKIDDEYIISKIKEIQQDFILDSKELLFLPVMLKAGIISRISKICKSTLTTQKAYAEAKTDALALEKGMSIDKIRTKFTNKVTSSYVEYLIYCLKRKGGRNFDILNEIDFLLFDIDESIDKIVAHEYEHQASRQMKMGNLIGSLTLISSMNWINLFNEVSKVEEILNTDPSGIYPKMDYETKEYYHRETVKLAEKFKRADYDVANIAISLCQNKDGIESHVGYYLIDDGRELFLQQLTDKHRFILKPSLYIATISVFSLIASIYLYYISGSFWLSLIALLPSSNIIINIISYIVSHVVTPKKLPKLEDFDIPPTLIVIPTLLPDSKRAVEMIDNLEVYYLSNKLENLYFALAGDFKDSDKEFEDKDNEIVDAATGRIEELNDKYGKEIFYYFNRRRTLNKNQNRWMGYERKRGALLELNKLIAGVNDTSYVFRTGNLPEIKYVITLDADTLLPKEGAKKLIGYMEHPLNAPYIDKERNLVTKGYGILQPQVSVDIESANKTLFSRIFAGQGGIDPYSAVCSDIYQDLFKEGIFTGKGIYSVEVFNCVLSHTLPENRILSHDLLEGCYLRCGLASDVELIDSYPAKYSSYSSRQHRWLRGDWQLLSWIFPKIKNADNETISNPLNSLSKWKIFDNLRRSMLPVAHFLLFLLSLSQSLIIFTWVAIISLLFPAIIQTLDYLLQRTYKNVKTKSYSTIIRGATGAFLQSFILILLLPHAAYIAVDAMLRALTRTYITKKNILEWVTAAESEKMQTGGLISHYRKMFISAVAGLIIIFIAQFEQSMILWGMILGSLWIISPYIAYLVSIPYKTDIYKLSYEEVIYLRKISRKTWRFFEDFMRPAHGYIPPDNFQENPPNGTADRASPTNIGITLLAILAAYDFGYIAKIKLCYYLTNIFNTIDKLEKWNGHLLNWYNTRNLKPLPPSYVSTVDSGNLAGYLLTLRMGLEAITDLPVIDDKVIQGLKDTVSLLIREGYNIDLTPLSEGDYTKGCEKILTQLEEYKGKSAWISPLTSQLKEIISADKNIEETKSEEIKNIIKRIDILIDNMDFSHLYSTNRGLFYIGYNLAESKPSNSYYDLLASEARQASFIAIAKGDIPAKHWFRLGRTLAIKDRYKGLASWSGTMFEYFMPRLIMKNIKNTLMDETYKFVMTAQLDYGKKRGVPWGVSESAFAAFDMRLDYQYKAFGIPELGFKRGLGEDTVIAPYSTMLALMSSPSLAVRNLHKLHELGAEGLYGFYEAVDYTPERQLRGRNYSIVKSYMVHHHGMSMLSLDNVLNHDIMQKRFHSSPMIKGIEYLLHERIPIYAGVANGNQKTKPLKKIDYKSEVCVRDIKPTFSLPAVQLLSNSTFCSMIDQNGCGYMKSGNNMITRFRRSSDDEFYGAFLFIRNCKNGDKWSATPFPMGESVKFRTFFHSHKAEFIGEYKGITNALEIAVSPEDGLEVRKLFLKNNTKETITLEITSYLEPVLGMLNDDLMHPAFGKLFISTEYSSEQLALLAKRNARSEEDKDKWMFHKLTSSEGTISEISYDTKRSSFIGRSRNITNPAAMDANMPLSGVSSAPIDPILALRCHVTIEADKAVSLYYITGAASDRLEALNLCSKYSAINIAENVFDVSLTRSRVVNKYLNISASDEEILSDLLSLMIYPSTIKDKYRDIMKSNTLSQECLWKHGISGDLPIFIYIASATDTGDNLELLLKAHEYWRLRGYLSDFIIITADTDAYNTPTMGNVMDIITVSPAREHLERHGGVFVKDKNKIEQEDYNLLITVARVVLNGKTPLNTQIKIDEFMHKIKLPEAKPDKYSNNEIVLPELEYYNEYGGFDTSNNEYVIMLRNKQTTPMPWSNVIANHKFGFITSESGGGYTWNNNSRENKLTPWTNDTITDKPGEYILVQDDDKNIWTTTKQPIDTGGTYVIRHGFGYSVYQLNKYGVELTQTMFAHVKLPLKYNIVKVKNSQKENRRLRFIYLVKPVLGVDPNITSTYITTKFSGDCMMAQNLYPNEFNDKLYISCSLKTDNCFNLENGFLHQNTFAICTDIVLSGEEEKEIIFTLSTEKDYALNFDADSAFKEVKEKWKTNLFGVSIETPDKSMNLLANGRLLYQTYCCRMLARTGFYQSSGAIGFRDQLQDSMAMLYTMPEITRKQLLLHAERQFVEGDVQHWWHNKPNSTEPPSIGIRTKFSDDLVWLPYVTAEYIEKTGDFDVLNEIKPFLTQPLLPDDISEQYSMPEVSEEKGSLYEHCLRALNRALKYGERGLPLMGSGDWNDGMNTIGHDGKGESVWLAFFLYSTLRKFLPLCEKMNDADSAVRYKQEMENIKAGVEKSAWDGEWYRRAYFDDGTPLGSNLSGECKIDSISQSWSVISGLAPEDKAKTAMDNVEKYLVDRQYGLIKLLTPPFEGEWCHPGYISSYIPGVRENGGQYTHAAIWSIIAYTMLGDGDKAAGLLGMINPINHTTTSLAVSIYKTEPYVLAADVYVGNGNSGQGGWTWYTGASGWTWRLCIEYILGLKKYSDKLEIKPCIPGWWQEYSITYKYKNAVYNISVKNPDKKNTGIKSLIFDGKEMDTIPLLDEGEHHIECIM